MKLIRIKKNVRHDIDKTLGETDERIEKLLLDKEVLHKKFLSESFIDKDESVNINGWDKNLSINEKRHLNTIGLDTSQAIKERLALENRMKENQTSVEYNKGNTSNTVREAKEVAFEIEVEYAKHKTEIEVKKLSAEEAKLAAEISALEAELADLETKKDI